MLIHNSSLQYGTVTKWYGFQWYVTKRYITKQYITNWCSVTVPDHGGGGWRK